MNAAYAVLREQVETAETLDRKLDEPLPHELTPRERELQEARKQADANRRALAMLRGS